MVDFGVFGLVVYFNMPDHPMRIGEIGNGNLYSLMAYFHLFWGLLLADGILTQYLIIIPLWNKAVHGGANSRWIIGACIALVCVLFAGALSYIIWLPEQGYDPLISFWWYMTEIQAVYWLINFAVLYLLDVKKIGAPSKPAEPEMATE
ncbi:hypothetical protein HYN43_012580 [Mucilaginibacter celer]|uniref:Uncharacterized protein n=1 Tax=Mucilaginibacter celer TaxID=2305508 RepID=A0A494VYI5_9SPHI|nr:hypothetical protein HYN43_012580 [Mucilaginibacter celer]